MIATGHMLRMQNGVVIAVPISESEAAEAHVVQTAINRALADAATQRISGKEITPFLLARVNELTRGASLKASM